MARLTHREQVERFWGLPVPPNLKHGNNTKAARAYGCDCKVCLPSGRRRRVFEDRPLTRMERARRHRANVYGTTPPPHIKHGIACARNYGCTCEVCSEAKRRANKRQAWLREWGWTERAYGRYTLLPDKTIVHWPPAGSPPDWKCPHCGIKPLEGATP